MASASPMPRATMVRRTADLRQLIDRWRTAPLLAIDTESNSLFAYHERVCLVQLSTREQDFIIDPLALDDLSPLGELLADPAIEIVFHAAEYDIISLKRDYGFAFSTLFDTMLAARICGWKQVGLGTILAEQFGVRADKKLQRANWARRPLPPEQLAYAQMDTHYLPALRDRLCEELRAADRLEEARELFADLTRLNAAEFSFDPEGYWRISAVRDLPRQQVAIVRALYLARDTIARRHDWPPFKVFGDEVLVQLASQAPRRLDDLYTVRGLNPRLAQMEGETILAAINEGRQARPPAPPRRPAPIDPVIHERYEALKEWRKQRAQARGVESDVILGREALWALARQAPTHPDALAQIPGLGPWRRAEYGAELIELLARVNGGPPR